MYSFVFRFVLIALVVAGLAACTPSSLFDKTGPEQLGQPIDQTPVVFDPVTAMDALNTTRSRFFMAGFQRDDRLMEAARRHAELMGRTGKFGHEFGPDTKFKRRIYAVGFENNAGENLGVGYRSIDEAIEGWLASPGHRKILLKRDYTLGGIAYAPNTSGKNPRLNHFWVLIVGKPE
jgi:uncharacterized protein YkwD